MPRDAVSRTANVERTGIDFPASNCCASRSADLWPRTRKTTPMRCPRNCDLSASHGGPIEAYPWNSLNITSPWYRGITVVAPLNWTLIHQMTFFFHVFQLASLASNCDNFPVTGASASTIFFHLVLVAREVQASHLAYWGSHQGFPWYMSVFWVRLEPVCIIFSMPWCLDIYSTSLKPTAVKKTALFPVLCVLWTLSNYTQYDSTHQFIFCSEGKYKSVQFKKQSKSHVRDNFLDLILKLPVNLSLICLSVPPSQFPIPGIQDIWTAPTNLFSSLQWGNSGRNNTPSPYFYPPPSLHTFDSWHFLPHIMLLSDIFHPSFSLLLISFTPFTFPSASCWIFLL